MGSAGYGFKQLGDELKGKKADKEIKPLTIDAYADDGEGAEWGVKDHINALRAEIHRLISGIKELEVEDQEEEKLPFEGIKSAFKGVGSGDRDPIVEGEVASLQDEVKAQVDAEEEGEELPSLQKLFTPELFGEFKGIIKEMKKSAKVEEEGESLLVDINSGEIEDRIENWVAGLKAHIKGSAKVEVTDEEMLSLDAQCWMLFDAIANTTNARTFDKGIKSFFKAKTPDGKKGDYDGTKKKCIAELGEKYGFSKVEMDILVDLVMAGGKDGDEYSLAIFVNTMARLWKEYKLGDQKKDLAKVVMGHFMATGATSFAPSMFANIVPDGNFNLEAFLAYTGLTFLGDFLSVEAGVVMEEVTNKINAQINERITQSLFFQEFEFIHEKSLGEIYSALERGKTATQHLLTEAIDEFAPILVGIAMSLGFMTKINPVLGGVGLAGLPVMYAIAKKHSAKIADIYREEIEGSESIATAISQVRDGLEVVRTSAESPQVEGHVRKLMGAKDNLAKDRGVKERKMFWKQMLPFDASSAIAGVVGSILQKAGALSGGEVLASIFYSQRLNGPIQRLVNLYFDKFARYIQDIKRMEEVLGKYETLDLPDGERETARVPVSELKDYGISIKDLNFKGILKNVNVEIKEGEFVVLTGPSGAGKSTLLRTIAGLNVPEQGAVKVGGVPVSDVKKYGPESIYTQMSYCNQSPQIFDEFSLRQNLVLWTKEEIPDEEIIAVMRKLHLDKFIGRLDEKVKHFSGGERVRIGVARTLLKGAKILLLDEPTASLDSTSSKEVRDVIKEMAKEDSGITIVCVTHDPELISVGERVIELESVNGKKKMAA